jgi:hypothetical protein
MIVFLLGVVALIAGCLLFKGFAGGFLIGLLCLFLPFVLARLFEE